MQKRCCNCFSLYDDLDGMCPHCGYALGDAGKELYYLSPGTPLKSPDGKEYIIGEVIGFGGFGIIYLAWEKGLERKVAIKEYYPSEMVTRGVGEQQVSVFSNKREAQYKKGLNNFLQEASIMSLCADCDNVCNSYNRFEANGTAYMVMEYLSGKTLKSYVKERNGEPLEESEILSFMIQTLVGLGEIHKRGVVHLDIAPDNIYVMPDGKIKIADFGAAKSKKIKKDDTEVVLKPGFAPPEQYRANAKVGPEADIYAVGANLYWLLTGQVPLEATDRENVDEMEEPAMLTIVSPALNNATMRAMAVKPELRYRNTQELIADLRKEKVRSVESELARRKRNRRGFLASVIVTLVLAVSFAGYWGYFKDRIGKENIIMWVVTDDVNAYKQESERYRDIVAMFQTVYPQVNVEIVVKLSDTVEQEFLTTPEELRPDLIETYHFAATTEDMLLDMDSLVERNKAQFLPVVEAQFQAKKTIPVGTEVSVIYAESGKQLSGLHVCAGLSEFINRKSGYCMSWSSEYLTVQDWLAGRYQVLEDPAKTIKMTEEFGIYVKGFNKKKAAKALLEYMLTDAAQDILHVRHASGYMPVIENAWNEYVNVYGEFQYLKGSIGTYTVEQ